MTDDKALNDQELAALFAQPTPVDEQFLHRVLADAYDVQAARAVAPVIPPVVAARPGLFKGMLEAIGGWPAAAGLATATLAGVWFGFAPPTLFEGVTASYFTGSGETIDLGDFMPAIDGFLVEG